MLLDEYYQQTLHAPVALPSGKGAPSEKPKKSEKQGWSRNRRR
jgi:hypothetical protein